MKIKLINKQTYNRLIELYKENPILTFQNVSFENIDRSKLNEKERAADNEINEILSMHIHDFVRFQNFKINKYNEIQIRFQYNYDKTFTGVGYILIDELHKGFKK